MPLAKKIMEMVNFKFYLVDKIHNINLVVIWNEDGGVNIMAEDDNHKFCGNLSFKISFVDMCVMWTYQQN